MTECRLTPSADGKPLGSESRTSYAPFRKGRQAIVLGGGIIILLALVLVHVTQGAASINIPTIGDAIFAPDGSTEHEIVRHLRPPRVTVGVLAGAAFTISGALIQTATRNPLSSETTLGINAGVYVALIVYIVFAPTLPVEYSFISSLSGVMVAFLGGIVSALLVYLIAAGVQITPVRQVLAGIAVGTGHGSQARYYGPWRRPEQGAGTTP